MPKVKGFTLIELSIVLVIIGLIVGGVLVGRDLINAAAVRAQISQIEKFRTAANTFKGKYGYLPGDIPDPDASKFGFKARGTYPGEGDGNGAIEGMNADFTGSNAGWWYGAGETDMFWVDLSAVNLIEGSFTTASTHVTITSAVSGSALAQWFPQAKLGTSNTYVCVWSSNGVNSLGLLGVGSVAAPGYINSGAGITVRQAYMIDSKIDDDFPQTGRVTTQYPTNNYAGGIAWAQGGGWGTGPYGFSDTTMTTGGPTTCFDNGAVNGATQTYSIAQNNGSGINCAISFLLQ